LDGFGNSDRVDGGDKTKKKVVTNGHKIQKKKLDKYIGNNLCEGQ
jgi:hypothetical protein